MSKLYIRWWKNQQVAPKNHEELAKMWLTLLEWVKAEQNAGLFTDWGACCDGASGYCIAESDEASVHSQLLKYQPYVIFSVKPVLTVDQTVASIHKAVAAASGR